MALGESEESSSSSSSEEENIAPRRVTLGGRVELSIEKRLEVIERLRKNVPYSVIQEEFRIGRATITRIKQKSAEYEMMAKNNENLNISRKRLKDESLEIDKRVFEWFCKAKEQNIHITGNLIQQKALVVANSLALMDFRASNGWLYSFQIRHNISLNSQANLGPEADTNPDTNSHAHTDVDLDANANAHIDNVFENVSNESNDNDSDDDANIMIDFSRMDKSRNETPVRGETQIAAQGGNRQFVNACLGQEENKTDFKLSNKSKINSREIKKSVRIDLPKKNPHWESSISSVTPSPGSIPSTSGSCGVISGRSKDNGINKTIVGSSTTISSRNPKASESNARIICQSCLNLASASDSQFQSKIELDQSDSFDVMLGFWRKFKNCWEGTEYSLAQAKIRELDKIVMDYSVSRKKNTKPYHS